jgi:hypothetical protein
MAMKYGHALDDWVGEIQDDIHRATIWNIYGVEPRRMRKRDAVLRVGEEVDLVYVEGMEFSTRPHQADDSQRQETRTQYPE